MKNVHIRFVAALLAAAMAMSLFACNSTDSEDSDSLYESVYENEATESEAETGEIDSGEDTSNEVISSEDTSNEATSSEESKDVESESTSESESNESESVTTETEDVEDTTESIEEETVVERVYGYDFKDSTWSSLFAVGGGASREIAIDPAGSGDAVLAIAHNDSQSASWIKNKTDFENTTSGKVTVSVDLYIPSEALSKAEDYVQMQINGAYNHHCNLVSDAKNDLSAFDTKDFPRDKWFKVQFIFDMDKLRYDLVVVEDGLERATVFSGRAASDLKESGPLVLRVFLGGASNTIYVDHHGVVTAASGETENTPEIVSGVSFLRIDGVNAAGESLSVYGDFSGDASLKDLTDITWEKCETYSGSYRSVNGVNGLDYTPSEGGYYLRVKAKYGAKTLTSYPVYIREEADGGFFVPYASFEGESVAAAIVYNNEKAEFEAQVTVIVREGDDIVKTYTESFIAKQGSDVVTFVFDLSGHSEKQIELVVTSGNDTLCKTTPKSELPLAKLQKTSNGSSVYIGKEMIAHFKNNRYMRFRATTANDHWIGTDHNPIDMGFAYQEKGVAGLFNISVDFKAVPGAFKIVFKGQKAGLGAEQTNELIGFWDADKQEFSFIYNASITADTQTWHENSSWAASGRIEAFDYCLERMSILDRVYNNNLNGDLYDYVIYENGDELVRIPKLPVPRTMLQGKYFYGFFLSPGESMYFPDAREGGWQSTLLSAVGDTYIEICWSWYDIHNCVENSVPRVGNCESFTISQSWLYTTTDAEHDVSLIDGAVEVEWQDIPNYQLPLFSTNNTFETQFGGTDWQYAWWKSSYDCTMDAEIGHDGAGSVKIEKATGGEASWYTEGVWGFPYSFDDVQGKTYRVSGYIKTENVVGEAYIANIQYQHATPDDNTVTRSESVTGTSDWTYVTFTFTAQERQTADGKTQRCIDHFFLTLNGTGKVWFDDVKIEEVQ
jgi:hypothetical protein